jgi:hypothetical protein
VGVVSASGFGALAVAAGGHGRPGVALLAMVVVVDLVAMVTTLPAALLTAVVCWGLHVEWVLGGPLFTSRSARDGLILLLLAMTTLGFASLVRAGCDHYESKLARIPAQRQEGSVTSSV